MAYREVLRMEIAGVVRRWQAGSSQRNIASGTGLCLGTRSGSTWGRPRRPAWSRRARPPPRTSSAGWPASAVPARGSLRGPARNCWAPGRTRSTGGSTSSACSSPAFESCWQPEGVRWPTRPCTGSSPAATGGAGAAARSGWRTPRRERWRSLDFGRLGLIQDPETGRRRTAWALIVVLAYSRHSFVWPTFSQKLEDVIAGLEAAWAPGGPDVETAVRTRPILTAGRKPRGTERTPSANC